MKKYLPNIILILIFGVGLSLLLYPTVSNWWNQRTQSRVISHYDEVTAGMNEVDYSGAFEVADEYNRQLAEAEADIFKKPSLVSGYGEALDVTGTGIMGYITIEKLGVELPIYHGTDAAVLQVAAGHLEGTSLPVGGPSTHSVLSAHRGLPSARLFTDLDQLEVGDTFTVTVLNRLLTYQVDQILIVLPSEADALEIVDEQDYCTLMTCTPYGINSHRLLVRGTRIENDVETPQIRVLPEAYKIDPLRVAPVVAAPLLLLLLIGLLFGGRKRK